MLRKKNFFFSVSFVWVFLFSSTIGVFNSDLMNLQRVQTQTFAPIPDAIVNPLMGWAPWASSSKIKQPHSMVYADLTWREFEPMQGVYDFETFEIENDFPRWRAENKRVVFRFVLDTPGDSPHMDIPDWLYAAINGDGDHYDNSYGVGFSPNYANDRLISYHKKVIQALASRYANDDFMAFIELGSIGHWGEWHVNNDEDVRQLPLAHIRDQYVTHYVEAFPNTLLLMRRPFTAADKHDLGLFNDMIGNRNATDRWLDWIANGGDYNETGEKDALVPMPEAWQISPMGGEQTGSLSDENVYGTNLDQMIQLVEASHTTFVGPNGPYKQVVGGPLQGGIDRVLASIGYRLYIQQVSMPFFNVVGTPSLQATITFANDGVAPFYGNWPAKIFLYDASGRVLKTIDPAMDVRKVMPGKPYPVSLKLSLAGLEKGVYTIGFAIIDPHTQKPGVRLAMQNNRQDLVQTVASFKILDASEILNLFLPVTRR